MLNAGRRYLGSGDLRGRVFVTSGLGGMSGAQAKAAVIAGCVGVIAEVSSHLDSNAEEVWGKICMFLCEFVLCLGGRGSSQKET